MASADKHEFDDQYLVRYLLGSLPAEEAERLDELSITNDEFAWRLREIENDLVDAYVRSQLKGETLNQFESFYLSSARRRQRVEFAEGLRRFQAARADRPAEQSTGAGSFLSRWLAVPRSKLQLGLAAAAFLVLLVAGYLFLDNARLRREVNDAGAQRGSLDQRTRELEKQLNEQRAANAEAQKKLDLAAKSAPDLGQLKTVSLLLPPPARGLSSIQNLTIRPRTDLVVLMLTLDAADFSRYRVTLKDPVANSVVWRSSELEPVSAVDKSAVSVNFPADLLKQQNYIAEVAGIARNGGGRIVGDYPFHVVLR
jgi:hypothetical protein